MNRKEHLLEVTGLRKRYGGIEALKGISFSVDTGEILAILGPNGAGKTTAIHCLAGLLPSEGGTLYVGGVKQARLGKDFIGLCPQEIIIWDQLTVYEQLIFIGSMYRLPKAASRLKANELLSALGLSEKRNAKGCALSGGMKRRLNIALSLIHDPRLIILDEPEAGLDPQSRLLVRDFLKQQSKLRSVVLTTHSMDEAQRIAGRVLLLDRGEVAAAGTVAGLLETHRCSDLEEVFFKLTGRSLRDNEE